MADRQSSSFIQSRTGSDPLTESPVLSPKKTGERRSLRIFLAAVLILVITFMAFSPCLQNGFVDGWDDNTYVRENILIRHLSWHNVTRVFSAFFMATYLPVTMLTYMVDYQLVGLNPFGYHLTSLILHLLNCLLVFWLIGLLSRNILVSFITAILFGVHPIHVESVAWISERKDVLYAAFFLLSMICYFYYSRTQKTGKAYWLALLFFILSLLSKAMAVTLPVLLLLVDYFSGKKFDRRMILDKIPFLVLALGFGLLGAHGQAAAVRSEPLIYRGLVPPYAVIFYLGKILWPAVLSSAYGYPGLKDLSIHLFSLAMCLLIFLAALRSGLYTKKFVFGSLFFILTLLPVLQFLPMGLTTVADRYAYLASTGIFFLIAESVFWGYGKIVQKNQPLGFGFAFILLVLLAGGLSVLTWKRCSVWKDSVSLWSDVLKSSPSSLAYSQRGAAYFGQKEFDKARADFEKAIASDPKFIVPYLNLGNVFGESGKDEAAIALFEKVLTIEPGNAEAYLNIAKAYVHLDRYSEAASFYEKVLVSNPRHAFGCYSYAILSVKMGKKEEAERLLKRALEIDPGDVLSYRSLALLYIEKVQRNDQLALYKKAIASGADYFEAYYAVGSNYQDAGDPASSIPLFKKALEIDPASNEARGSLGTAYCAVGQSKKAVDLLAQVLKTDPENAVVHNNIALAYYYQKQYALAIQHCDKAIELGYQVKPSLLELLKPFRKFCV